MSFKELNEIVLEAMSEPKFWGGDVMELSDDYKDRLAAKWLESHPTWLEDIYPHTCSDRYSLAIGTTYALSSSRMLAAMFRDAAEDNKHNVDDDAYWSEALGDFENILDNKDFASEVRDRIYLYLEPTLQDKVTESYQYLVQDLKEYAGVH